MRKLVIIIVGSLQQAVGKWQEKSR